jgi:hypothetical protein
MGQLRAPVQAPPARPPLYGLLAAAPTVDDPELRDLAGGWKFQPEGCGLGGIDLPTCEGNVGAMDPSDGPAQVEGMPVWVWEGDECSTFGFGARDWMGRARRALAATESFRIARELWDGDLAAAEVAEDPTFPNRWLASPGADSDTVTSGASDVKAALACVEQALGEALRGQRGMVHVTPQVLTHLAGAQLGTQNGGVWTTPMGNVIVADAGYTGAGPGGAAADGTGQWIYGTPMLQVRLGPVEVIPGNIDNATEMARALDRGDNTVLVYAGRLAGIQWANECAHIAAQVDVPVCAIGGAS